jgi:putative endonuclease
MKNHKRSHYWGIVAEHICIIALIIKGYSVLSLRYRNVHGEIDIIAAKNKLIVFIEVKARTNKDAALLSVGNQNKSVCSARPAHLLHRIRNMHITACASM